MATNAAEQTETRIVHLRRVLNEQGDTMVALAEDANVTRQALYNVVSGESGSPRLRAYIETRYPEVIEAHPWV